MPDLSQSYKGLVLLLCVPAVYCVLVLFGRRLKRQHGVKLGWLYHLFSLSLAVYAPAVLLGLPWTFLRHLGAVVIMLSSAVIIALVDRFLWEVYFQSRYGAAVPKFLTELVRLLILALAAFLVL